MERPRAGRGSTLGTTMQLGLPTALPAAGTTGREPLSVAFRTKRHLQVLVQSGGGSGGKLQGPPRDGTEGGSSRGELKLGEKARVPHASWLIAR